MSHKLQKSIVLGEKIKNALIKNDPEAAQYLIKRSLNTVYSFNFYYPAKI